MTSRLAADTAALAVDGAISAGSVPTLGPSSATAGTVDPAQFDRPRQNEYFPLEPGTIARSAGPTTVSGTSSASASRIGPGGSRASRRASYAPGLGIVREKDMSGGDESFVLVSVGRRHR